MTKGVCGNVTVLAPTSVFATWNGEEPSRPKGFVGIDASRGMPLAVFHDKENTYAIPHRGAILLLQSIYGGAPDAQQLAQLPADKWKRLDGSYASDGGEHVLFESMYSSEQYADADMQMDIEAEAGLPIRITIPAGSYALEAYGEWSPATNTEYMLSRLVPSGAAPAKAAAPVKKAASAKAAALVKKAAPVKKPVAKMKPVKKAAAAKKQPPARKPVKKAAAKKLARNKR